MILFREMRSAKFLFPTPIALMLTRMSILMLLVATMFMVRGTRMSTAFVMGVQIALLSGPTVMFPLRVLDEKSGLLAL